MGKFLKILVWILVVGLLLAIAGLASYYGFPNFQTWVNNLLSNFKDKLNNNVSITESDSVQLQENVNMSQAKNNRTNMRNYPDISVRGISGTFNGEITKSGDSFMSFDTLENGDRAGMINLHSHLKEGQNTISLLISSLSPPSENDTSEYIQFVCGQLGIQDSDDISEIILSSQIMQLISAIETQEGNNNIDADENALQNAYNDYASKFGLNS